jgi:CubicO group peptidase (beta-lactamase class C family)
MAWLLIPVLRGAGTSSGADYWPTNGWRTSTPEEQGFDSVKLSEGLQAIREKDIAIDSLLIARNGYMVVDADFFPYDGSFPHDVASVTKTVMATLIGIAADQGKLRLDQPMVSFFPDRTVANLDKRKESITIRDLVSNRNGMESGCFKGDEPTLDKMRTQPDWVQAALDRKMVHAPGTSFCYDSPGMHLLSAILQKATGMTALDFARLYLFGPLGIREGAWESDPQGYTHGWGDLHLKPEDAAKLGYLWLQGGVWDGRHIVSSSWTRAAAQAQSRLVGNEYGYGYGWWVSPIDFYALGRGGQFVRVIPSLNTVVVITAGGLDFNQVESFLVSVLLRANKPLSANPAGVAELNATLAELVQGPAPQPAESLPSTASAVSDQIYACPSNAAGVTNLRLDFNDPKVARLSMTQHGMDVVWLIGLDGKFRPSPDGQEMRGYWKDSQTFILEAFDVGLLTRGFEFKGDQLVVSVPDASLTFTCQAQTQ